MTSLWIVGIRPQSESNILLEYRLFEYRYVKLKSYMAMISYWSQWIVKSYSDRPL